MRDVKGRINLDYNLGEVSFILTVPIRILFEKPEITKTFGEIAKLDKPLDQILDQMAMMLRKLEENSA